MKSEIALAETWNLHQLSISKELINLDLVNRNRLRWIECVGNRFYFI